MADKTILTDRSRLSVLAVTSIIGHNILPDVLSKRTKYDVTTSERVFAKYDFNMSELWVYLSGRETKSENGEDTMVLGEGAKCSSVNQ